MAIGPIIRIGPNEVHINDSQFYDVLYSQSRPANKLESLMYRFNSPLSVFSAVDHGLHRRRRAALNPLFSKQKVTSLSPFIQKHMDELCERISREFSGNGGILVLNKVRHRPTTCPKLELTCSTDVGMLHLRHNRAILLRDELPVDRST